MWYIQSACKQDQIGNKMRRVQVSKEARGSIPSSCYHPWDVMGPNKWLIRDWRNEWKSEWVEVQLAESGRFCLSRYFIYLVTSYKHKHGKENNESHNPQKKWLGYSTSMHKCLVYREARHLNKLFHCMTTAT